MSGEALRVLEGGRAPGGWEALWLIDVWRQSELPHGDLAPSYDGEVLIHFEGLLQPWLKEAAKRWARARLLAETTPQTMSRYLTELREFSGWLAARAPDVATPALLSRGVLEEYLLWVRSESGWKPATCSHRVVALRLLLDEQADDGLAGLPRGAVIHRTELPRVDYRLPKQLGGEIFQQWVDPANIALLDHEQHRTIVLLLAYTGFRVSSVVTLARDARELGPDGQPYLRYWKSKLSARRCCRSHRSCLTNSTATKRSWSTPTPRARSGCCPPRRPAATTARAARFTSRLAQSGGSSRAT